MKRLLLVTILAGLLSACRMATTAVVSPPVTPTATHIPPVHFETNSVMPGLGESTDAAETPPPQEVDVLVYFTMSNDVEMAPVSVGRTVPNSDNLAVVAHSTLKELLKGPTDAEKAQGLISWFSSATAHSLTSVSVYEGEIALDFSGLKTLIPNASTSAGSQMLLSQLNNTVFQFPSIQSVHYTLDGNCRVFWEWLQYECHPVTRADWEKG
jgi:spore germination protein GerM